MAATDVPKLQLATAPLLCKNPTVEDIIEWRLRANLFYQNLGIGDVTVGNPPGQLPGNALAVNVTLGKRYILACIQCPDTLVLLQAQANGPAIWNFIATALMGGRDEQAAIQSIIEGMHYDGTTSIVAFFGRFSLFANAVVPAMGHNRKCLLYSMRFSSEVLSVISGCDINPGHNNFDAYAAACTVAINLNITRQSGRIF